MIVRMLKTRSIGARVYSENVDYEMEKEVADALIASGDAEAVAEDKEE